MKRASASIPQLQISTLGGLSIQLAGRPLKPLASRKAEALLVYLACSHRAHSRESLADLLWDDRTQEQALGNLRVLLTSLRKELSAFIEVTRQTIEFPARPEVWLDSDQLETQFAAARVAGKREENRSADSAAKLARAVALYRGDFLQGFHLREATGFEEWSVVERERWQRIAVEALTDLIDFHLQAAEFDQGLAQAARLLQIDPLREDIHRRSMQLSLRAGRRSAALDQYATCRQILQRELGLEPAEETTRLYQRIVAAESAPRSNLDDHRPLTAFVGRQRELKMLVDRLAKPDCRLLTLIGPGGSGKSRLAFQLAEEQRDVFLNGVFFIPLAALDSAEFLIEALAEAVGCHLSQHSDLVTQLINFLRNREMLLVLDNFEQWRGAVDVLSRLLKSAPDVKLLITSRERLNLQAEWLIELQGLSYPQTLEIDQSDDALQLFKQGAERVNANFQFEAALSSVVRICQLVQGLPLAIELAAAWSRELTCAAIVTEIESGLDILATSLQDVPERHRSLRAVFDHSWRQLTAKAQALFSVLSAFRGGFTYEAAHEIAAASVNDLSDLLNRSLLQHDSSERYDLHDLLRQYAFERLAAEPDRLAAVQRSSAEYFAKFLQERTEAIRGRDQQSILKSIAIEIDNIRMVWPWLIEQRRYDLIDRSLETLYDFYDVQGWYRESEALFGQSVEHADRSAVQARLLARQAGLRTRLGEFDKAKELFERSLEILREQELVADLPFTLSGLGNLELLQGRADQARELQLEGLKICRALNDRSGIGRALNSLGAIANRQGKFHEAQQLHLDALAVHRAVGDEAKIAVSLNNLGVVTRELGEYAEARKYYEESVALRRKLGDRRGLALAINNLGNVAIELAEYAEAQGLHAEGLALHREIDDRWGVALSLHNLGDVAAGLEDFGMAEKYYRQSLTLRREIGDQVGVAYSLEHLGRVALTRRDLPTARQYFNEAVQIAREQHLTQNQLAILGDAAQWLMAQGQIERAIEILALVLNHPASDKVIKRLAQKHLKQLPKNVARAVFERALVRGQSLSLEKVIIEFSLDEVK